jgi:chemotaxis protein CheC
MIMTDSQQVAEAESLTRENMATWTWMVSKGIGNAISGLSEMTGHQIRVNSLDLKWLSINKAAMLLGGTDSLGVGIYLAVEGEAKGHLLLVHEPRVAFELIDTQLELPLGSTQQMGEMERCALEDIGNITGNCFLNTLADCADMVLMPSPPRIILDTVKAIMEIPLEYIGKGQENVLAVKATFSSDERQIDGSFLILPTMDFMKSILKKAKITPDLA